MVLIELLIEVANTVLFSIGILFLLMIVIVFSWVVGGCLYLLFRPILRFIGVIEREEKN